MKKLSNIQRVESLDWLRGLMAFAIMIYHLSIWLYQPFDSSTFLGKIGIYGVSIFFVLSGLSMAIVYNNSINSINQLWSFFLKRVFRIVPLLFLATTLTILPNVIFKGEFDFQSYLLNITSLFGFFDYSGYIAIGAWSIGNEIVYYSLTPLIFCAYNKSRLIGNSLFLMTIVIALFFAFYYIDASKNLEKQWSTYINPFNNLFLYVAGIAIYYNLREVKIQKHVNYFIILLILFLFLFYPVSGNTINIITGNNRLLFSFLAIQIVFSFYKLELKLNAKVALALHTLGLATYGIYLYHPIVYSYFSTINYKLGLEVPVVITYSFVIIFTIIISVISYNKFELKFSNYGKKLIKKYITGNHRLENKEITL